MGRLSSISSNPTLREYAQGAAQSAIAPVADFLAPAVNVPTSTGRYKVYSEKNRFHIPNTLRAVGGRATELRFEATDATYNCEPHAIDFPVDNLEQIEAAQLESVIQEGADAVAEVAGLSHEQSVINTALTALGPGTDLDASNDSTVDLVDSIDEQILEVIKAAKYGSLMGVGLLFGATAFRRYKNHPKTYGRILNASGRGRSASMGQVNITVDDIMSLQIGNPDARISFMVHDTAGPGETDSISFLLDAAVIIFARKASPTRRDPSFMKTMRLSGMWMVPGSYMRDDGRVEVAKMDWSEDVVVTNSAAGKRLNFNAS